MQLNNPLPNIKERPCGHSSRVLVFGVDSADFSYLAAFREKGELPAFAKSMNNGTVKVLESAIPDMTPPSWTSIFTGVNPGQHGIYGFFQPSGTKVIATDRTKRKARAVWNALGPDCHQIVMNVPMTNPAEHVKGCMVSDALTSPEGSDWIFPNENKNEILATGYKDCFDAELAKTPTLDVLCRSIESRSRAFVHLLDKYPWCLAAVVFSCLDRAIHAFPASEEKILTVYKAIDRALERVLTTLDSQTTVLIVSDHGSIRSSRYFFTNNWLIRAGLLHRVRYKAERPWANLSRNLVSIALPIAVRLLPISMIRSLHGFPSFFRPSENLSDVSGLYHLGWDLGRYCRVYLTDDCRTQYSEYYQKLTDEARKLIDHETGRSPVRRVLSKKNVYTGVHSLNAPDFVLDIDPSYLCSQIVFNPPRISAPCAMRGTHRPDGIFIAYGPKRNLTPETDQLNVLDIVPLILRILQQDQK